MENGIAIVENKHSSYVPAIPLLGMKTKEMKINIQMQKYLIITITSCRSTLLGQHTRENAFQWMLKILSK